MQNKLSLALEQALQGSCQVQITFKRDAANSVRSLLRMIKTGHILMPDDEEKALKKTAQSGGWGEDRHRTTNVTFTSIFVKADMKDTFARMMRLAIEQIEVVPS